MCTLPSASPGWPCLVPPLTRSAMTATYPGASVGTPVGSGVGVGVGWPAGAMGGGVSPPRCKKIGTACTDGFGVGVGIGGGLGCAVSPGRGRGVSYSSNVPLAAPGCEPGRPGVAPGDGETPGERLGAGDGDADWSGAVCA